MLWVRRFPCYKDMWAFIDDMDLSVAWYPRLLHKPFADAWELTWCTPDSLGDRDGNLPLLSYAPGDEMD